MVEIHEEADMNAAFSGCALALVAAAALPAQELKVNALVITWYHQMLDNNLRLDSSAPYYALGGSKGAGSQEPMRENGFSIRRAEIYLNGKLNDEFSAGVIFDPKESNPLLLDATITWKPSETFEVKAGQFKPLLTYEAVSVGSPDLIFVDRSQYARRFGDIRDRGLTVATTLGDKDLSVKLTGGVFNGANRDNDANAQKDYVARVDLSAGAHKAGAYGLVGSTDVKDTTGLGIVPAQGAIDAAWGPNAPSREAILDHKDLTTAFGAYYRFTTGPWHADAEVVTGQLGRRFATLAATSPTLKREHLDQKYLSAWITGSYRFAERHIFSLRYDYFDFNAGDDWYTDYNPYKYSAVGVRRTVNGSVVDYTPCFTEATLGYTFVWDPKLVRRANFKLNYIWRSKNFLAPNAGQSGEQGGDSLVAAFQVYF